MAPYYPQDKDPVFQGGDMDAVSGLTQPPLDLLPQDFSAPNPPKRCHITSQKAMSQARFEQGLCFFQSSGTLISLLISLSHYILIHKIGGGETGTGSTGFYNDLMSMSLESK